MNNFQKKPLSYDVSFFDRCVGLFLGLESGHMGSDLYQHHEGHLNGHAMSGVTLWDNHAKTGTIPRLERSALDINLPDIAQSVDTETPVVAFGPTAGTRKLVSQINSASYIPVDSCADLLRREKNYFQDDVSVSVNPALLDFFEGNATKLIDVSALGALMGMTISNLPGPAPVWEPEENLTSAFRHFSRCLPHGGHFLVSMDSNQNGGEVKELYNEKWHRLFGVNFLYRIASELPTSGFNPDCFEYAPIWHPNSGLLAHSIRATEDQSFILGQGRSSSYISVKKGDVFHYNNSFKYRPEFFRMCAARAGLSFENCWDNGTSIKVFLFKLPVLAERHPSLIRSVPSAVVHQTALYSQITAL